MKARRVEGLDPSGPLRRNAARIVPVRLDELRGFADAGARPGAAKAQHDMRIAAKRLRYVLEIAEPCFGAEATAARDAAKQLQAVLGDIHDCDVMLPRSRESARCDPSPRPPRAALPRLPRALAGRGEQGHLGRARTRSLARAGHRFFTAFPAVHKFSLLMANPGGDRND